MSRSLGTASKREAVAAALPLRLFAFQVVRFARTGGCTLASDDLERLMGEARAAAARSVTVEAQEQARDEAEQRERAERAHRAQLAAVEAGADARVVEAAAESQRLREIAKAGIHRALHVGREKLAEAQQVHTEQLVQVVTSASKSSAEAAAAAVIEAGRAKPGPLLSVLVADYLRERATTGAGNEKTQLKLKTALGLLVGGLGDRPANQVTRGMLVEFLGRLRRLPSNPNKIPALVGLTFEQLTDPAAPVGKPIADNTVNGHMTRISGMFKWALATDEYGLRANPAAALGIERPMAVKRKPFTVDQLVALFSHENFTTRRFMHSHYYWLMPIAALSGMRLNEACQLQLSDFTQVDGVDIVSCADLDEGRRGKNDNARRRVPVLYYFTRLGLLRWVEKLRAAGEVQLFPELKERRDGHGQAPSKWFQGYRAACGIEGEQVYVFHSFRHYFIRRCLAAREMVQNIAAVVGHETDLVTIDIYGQDFDITVLNEAVNKVSLPPEVLALIPTVEECTFTKKPTRRPPSRLGARKSREQRIADAAARKKKGAPGGI